MSVSLKWTTLAVAVVMVAVPVVIVMVAVPVVRVIAPTPTMQQRKGSETTGPSRLLLQHLLPWTYYLLWTAVLPVLLLLAEVLLLGVLRA
jgi:hypothetical protein